MRRKVKIEFFKNSESTGYEVYIDGNRINPNLEFRLISIVGIEYLSKRLPLSRDHVYYPSSLD